MTRLADYQCTKCEHEFEYMTHGEEDLPECPECGSKDVRQLAAGLNPTKCHDPAVKKEILQKRSFDHDVRNASKNVERIKARMKR